MPLLEEIGKWFRNTLNSENFGKTLNMIHKLKKLGFSEDELSSKISLTPAVIEFVNNSSREEFTDLLSDHFDNMNLIILKALFSGENNHFDILLGILSDKMNSEEHCELILQLFSNMLESKHSEVLCVFSSEVNLVIEQIESVSPRKERLGPAVKFLAALNKLKTDRGMGTPRTISLELLHRTRCWRKYSLSQLRSLKDNMNIRCFHFAEIVLDWTEQIEPLPVIVGELWNLVLDKLDVDVNRSPYPQYYRYRYDVNADFKRLFLKAGHGSDCKGHLLRLRNFLQQTADYIISINLNSTLLIAVIAWFWLIEPSNNFLAINGGRTIFILFILNYHKALYFGIFQFIYKWNVKISVGMEGIKKLANSRIAPVKLKAYSSELSFVRLLPYFYCNLQLVNHCGMGKLCIQNSHRSTDYHINHWYMRVHYDNVQKPFYSVFTHTYGEIVDFLNERYKLLLDNDDLFSRLYRSLVYYLFGWSPINLCTINYELPR